MSSFFDTLKTVSKVAAKTAINTSKSVYKTLNDTPSTFSCKKCNNSIKIPVFFFNLL